MAGLTKGVLKVTEHFLFHNNQENTTSRFTHGDRKPVCITGQNLFVRSLQDLFRNQMGFTKCVVV